MSDNDKKNVLIVEDTESWRNLLKEFIEKDYNVTVCKNSGEAMQALENRLRPFHVAILDIRLVDGDGKNQDGLEIANFLNSMGEYTKAVMLTGYPTVDTVKTALWDCKVFDYLEKSPDGGKKVFSKKDFLEIVHKAADESEKLKSNRKYLYARFEQEDLVVGESNFLILNLENEYKDNAVKSILLPPSPHIVGRGEALLQISAYGVEMEVPVDNMEWKIPYAKEVPELKIRVIPTVPGNQSIVVDINNEQNWLGSVTIEKKVAKVNDNKMLEKQ